MESKNMDYNDFRTHEEYIESLVKMQIRKKRETLKITKEVTDLDFSKLKRIRELEQKYFELNDCSTMRNLYYNPDNLSSYNFYDSIGYACYTRTKCKSLYSMIKYGDYKRGSICFQMYDRHRDGVFKRILEEFLKNIHKDFDDIIENGNSSEEISESLNNYLIENSAFKYLNIKFISKDEIDEIISKDELDENDKFYEFLKETYSKKFSKWSGDFLEVEINDPKLENDKSYEGIKKFYYPIGYTYDRKSLMPRWYDWYNRERVLDTKDLCTLIAVSKVAKISFDYFNRDEDTKNRIYKDFKQNLIIEDESSFLKVLNFESFIKDVEMNEYYINPNLTLLFVLCMSNIVGEELDIQDLERRLEQSKSNYATSYITKKNIPKSIQEFMEDNKFLNIFSYVEADELCDLDKLHKIEEEFVGLTNLISIPKMDTYSLRFRRLGRQKALGLYYPIYRTMCVDIRSVSSFIHEFFHMIDYKLGILSLDSKFKPLKAKVTSIIHENMNEANVSEANLKIWYSKNKYGSKYYLSNDEIFARLGEIYVREILGIKTSFNKREFVTDIDKIIYKYDDELLNMIKEYFDDIFSYVTENCEIVKL